MKVFLFDGTFCVCACVCVCGGVFLNQAHAHSQPSGCVPGLLKLFSEKCVCVCVCMYTCNSCNTGMKAFSPQAVGHTYQAQPEFPVLQLICNT